MKRIITLFSALAMCALMLTGCTSDNPTADENGHVGSTTTLTEASQNTGYADTGDSSENHSNSQNDAPNDAQGEAQGNENADGDNSPAASESEQTALLASAIGWGLGTTRDSYNRPTDAVSANEKYGKYNAVFVGEPDEKKICLTFDEGYENGYTSKILDILKEKNAEATFFVTYDYCKKSPELVQRMIEEGHTVGNHSYTHCSFPSCSEREITEEIMYLHDYVKENFGYTMSYIRFPKGEFDEKSLKIAQKCGYKTVFWSFAHDDWDTDNQPTAKEAFDKITSQTHNGAIYLLHAVSKANTDCLSDVLDYWSNNGFRIAPMTEF